MVKLTEASLRRLIRNFLAEQVVGYQAPSKSYDDPLGDDDPASKPASSSGDDAEGYLSVGDMGVDTSLHGSQDEEQVSGMQVKSLTQQRQTALDQGDSVKAANLGKQLSMARKMRG